MDFNFCFNIPISWRIHCRRKENITNHESVKTKDTCGHKAMQSNTTIAFRKINCTGDCSICTPRSIGDETGRDLDATFIIDWGDNLIKKKEVRIIKAGMNIIC